MSVYMMDFSRSGNGREIEKLDLSSFIRYYQFTKEIIASECIEKGVPASFRMICGDEKDMSEDDIKDRGIVLDALERVYLKNNCWKLSEEIIKEFKENENKKLLKQSKIIKFMVVMYLLLISYFMFNK